LRILALDDPSQNRFKVFKINEEDDFCKNLFKRGSLRRSMPKRILAKEDPCRDACWRILAKRIRA
jgi:hypothetical protein